MNNYMLKKVTLALFSISPIFCNFSFSQEISLRNNLVKQGFKCEANICSFNKDDADIRYVFNNNSVNISSFLPTEDIDLLITPCRTAFKVYLDNGADTADKMLLSRIDNNSNYLDDDMIFYSRTIGDYFVSVGYFSSLGKNATCYISKVAK